MKTSKIIITILVITGIVVIIVARLITNKKSFDQESKMVSESSNTIPVVAEKVDYKPISSEFYVNGSFSASQEISISSEIKGTIVSINAETGDHVTSGQVLASMNNKICTSQLELAKFNLEKAEKDMHRNEQMIKADGITQQQYEQSKQTLIDSRSALASAQNQYDNSFIKAPFDGIITKRYVENGTFLSTGTIVFDMVKISKVKFVAKLTAEEVLKISKGQHVNVSVEAFPGTNFDGVIYAINIKADQSKRYEVEIELNNSADKQIKPGMFGTARVTEISDVKALVISRKALTGSVKKPEVFIVKGDSVVSQKIVVTPLNENEVLINEGLKEGDMVVTSGQINLVNGSKIKLL